jgi:beta-glucosidase
MTTGLAACFGVVSLFAFACAAPIDEGETSEAHDITEGAKAPESAGASEEADRAANEEDGDRPSVVGAAASRCPNVTSSRRVTVKVMTINLRHDSDDWKRRFPLIANEIVRLDPDIIALQEIEIADDQSDALNDLISARGHARYNVYEKRKSGFWGFFTGEGVGLMTRWSMVEKNHEDLGEMRISLRARVKHPSGGFIDVMTTHLHNEGGAAADAERLEQAKQTVDLADRHDDCWPTFLGGDMNASETSPALKHFVSEGFADSYKTVHGATTSSTGMTSPIILAEGATQNPRRRIDFVLGRAAGARTLSPIKSEVCFKNKDAKGFYPSDHLGVMTTYEVGL